MPLYVTLPIFVAVVAVLAWLALRQQRRHKARIGQLAEELRTAQEPRATEIRRILRRERRLDAQAERERKELGRRAE